MRVATGTVAAPPLQCPMCEGLAEMQGEYLVCGNAIGCPAQAVGRIRRYVETLGIKEWGNVLIEKLVEMGLVEDPGDLYALTVAQLVEIDGVGQKSATKIIKSLQSINKIPLDTFLGALSIPLCGPSTIRLAMDAGFDTLDLLKAANIDQLRAVEGLGPARAQALRTWLAENFWLIAKILSRGVELESKPHGSLSGKSVCFTGSLERPRAELEQLVKRAGGDVKTSVGKKLSYLVLADPTSNSSKAQAARKNGTACVSEQQLLEIIGGV